MLSRKTAILRIQRIGTVVEDAPLDSQREYGFTITVDQAPSSTGAFCSPLGDDAWHTFIDDLGNATKAPDTADLRRALTLIRGFGRKFHDQLERLDPALGRFLADTGPRRLVIESNHPEIHKLPWESIVGRDWKTPAAADLSIVHTLGEHPFSREPRQSGRSVTVATVAGPGTPAGTAAPLAAIAQQAPDRIKLVSWRFGTGEDRPDARDRRDAANKQDDKKDCIYNVEAHGDLATGKTDVEAAGANAIATDLPERIRGALAVMLWTCHAGRIRSWGESPAMVLHQRGNTMVLAFQTELRFDSAAALSRSFYGRVLGNRRAMDPETAAVTLRSDLFDRRLNACEWASLTVWMHQPVDVSAAALDGPRVPESSWTIDADNSADLDRLRKALKDETFPGRPVLLTGISLPDRLPLDVVAAYRGPVVRIDASALNAASLPDVLDPIGVTPESRHQADRLLALLRTLGAAEDSLLLWTSVTATDAAVFGHVSTPSSVRVVLTSTLRLDAPVGVFLSNESPAADVHDAPWPDDLVSRVEHLEQQGRYAEAATEWRAVSRETIDALATDERRRLFTAAYWAIVRLESPDEEIRACLEALSATDRFEALLLRANHEDRAGLYAEARRTYHEAQQLAQGSAAARGRVLIELAYLAAQSGDRGLAESNYREALTLLHQIGEAEVNGRWGAALGRALRDYADLLSADRTRALEADALLQRAIAIHTIDGRAGQVAAAFQTRGKTYRTLQEWDRAESALIAAASLQAASGNVRGWASGIRDLAQLAYDGGRYGQALKLAEAAYFHLENRNVPMWRPEAGMAALLASRCAWRLGAFADAMRWIEASLDRLPRDRRRERADASGLKSALQSIAHSESAT